jgi:hypothetical protein
MKTTSALTWALVAAASASPVQKKARKDDPSESLMEAFAAGNMSHFLGGADASM